MADSIPLTTAQQTAINNQSIAAAAAANAKNNPVTNPAVPAVSTSVNPNANFFQPGQGGNPISNQSTTTLSTSNAAAKVPAIQQKTNELAQTGIMTDPASGVATYANGSVYTPPDTTDKTQPTSQTGGYYGDQYIRPGDPLPKDATGKDVTLTDLPPTAQSNIDSYTKLLETSDANTSSMVAAVKAQYDQLIQQQTQANTANAAGRENILLGNGGEQHTLSGGDVLHSEISYGLSQLADLSSKEQMAIAQAQQAGLQNNFQIQSKINDQIEQIRQEKATILQKQANDIAAANQKLADDKKAQAQQAQQAARDSAVGGLVSQGITDPNKLLQSLNYDANGNQIGNFTADEISKTLSTLTPDKENIQKLAQTLGENGADPALIQKVLSAGSLSSAIALAGSSLQDPKLQLQMQQLQLSNELTKANIVKAQKETSLLGEPTAAENKASAAALTESKAAIPVMQDKIAAVDELKTAPGLSSRVGTSILSRAPQSALGAVGKALTGVGLLELPGDAMAAVSGSGQEFAGGVHKLVNGLTLQNLIDAKARGATFGALSEGELNLLASSASQINDWEVKDGKGNGTGYWNIDETDFNKELDNVKMLTQRALTASQGSVLSPDESSLLDKVYQPTASTTSPAAYFNN